MIVHVTDLICIASLKLQGADAQNHAVFTELKRIQQYFAKIKAAEEPEAQRNLTVNQEAAARMLKSDLVGLPSCHHSLPSCQQILTPFKADNKSISSKLAEKIAEERAKALLKSMETGNRKRPAADSPQPEASASQQKGNKKPKNKTDKGNSSKKSKKGSKA